MQSWKPALTISSLIAMFIIMPPGAARADLLLEYLFDEASSGTTPALDTGTGTAANGSFNGGSTRTGITPGGASTGALDTNGGGINDYLDTGGVTPAKLDGLTTFTLSTWLNLQNDPGVFDRLISMHAASGGGGFDFFIEDDLTTSFGANNFSLSLAADASTTVSSAAITPADGWIFLAVTYNGNATNNNVFFYWGDEATGVAQIGGAGSINRGTLEPAGVELRIGGTSRSTSDRSPDAYFDNVRIHDTVLTGSELEAIRAADVIPEPGTLALLAAGLGLLAGLRRRT